MEVTVGRLQLIAFNHPVNWTNSTGGALAIPHIARAAHIDFENRLAVGVIFEDFDITVFNPVGFVSTNTGIGLKQDLVVQLLGKVAILSTVHDLGDW